PGLERHPVAGEERLIHHRRQPEHRADRRLCAELTLGEYLADLAFIRKLYIVALKLIAQRVEIDAMRRRQRADEELTIRFDNHRLDHPPAGNVLGGGQILGGIRRIVTGKAIVNALLIEIVLYVHYSD